MRIKPFTIEKMQQEMNYDSEDKEFSESKDNAMPNAAFNQLPPHTHTCTLTGLLIEHQSISFIEKDLRYKLGNISEKLYRHQTPLTGLTSEEQKLWLSFDIGDITFFLSGQQEQTSDYSQYL